MKLVAISTVKNERDILEAFVRHTASFVDHHLVIDNGSTDSTRDILDALVAEGLPLTVLDDPSPGAWQARRMNRLMHRAAAEFAPDWVVPLDADEFLVTKRMTSLRRLLKKQSTPVFVRWRTYVPDVSDDADEPNPVVRIRHRLAVEGHEWFKVLVPGSMAAAGEFQQGSHDLILPPGGTADRVRLDGAHLAHFPVRSAAQFARKVAIGRIQYLARVATEGLAFHYEEPFALLMRDWERFAARHREAAARFALPPGTEFDPELVRDPLAYAGGPLRHTPPPRSGDPWMTILEYTMQLATEVGRLTAGNHGEVG